MISDAKRIEEAIDLYYELRASCYRAAKDDGSLMGNYAWLRAAMMEHEIEIYFTAGRDNIHCSGTTFTNQTQSHESFAFDIPLALINLDKE